MTGFRQVQGKINEQVAADLGTNTYEVSYHVGARPSHQPLARACLDNGAATERLRAWYRDGSAWSKLLS